MARHFEDHIHAQASGLFHDHRAGVFFGGIEHVVGLHVARDLAPVFIHFDSEHGRRAHCSRHCDGK